MFNSSVTRLEALITIMDFGLRDVLRKLFNKTTCRCSYLLMAMVRPNRQFTRFLVMVDRRKSYQLACKQKNVELYFKAATE